MYRIGVLKEPSAAKYRFIVKTVKSSYAKTFQVNQKDDYTSYTLTGRLHRHSSLEPTDLDILATTTSLSHMDVNLSDLALHLIVTDHPGTLLQALKQQYTPQSMCVQ